MPYAHPITRNVFKNDRSLGNPLLANKTPTYVPPSAEELGMAMTVGIDAEFVALTAEETELVCAFLCARWSRAGYGEGGAACLGWRSCYQEAFRRIAANACIA